MNLRREPGLIVVSCEVPLEDPVVVLVIVGVKAQKPNGMALGGLIP